MGPLNGLFFRLAKVTPDVNTAASLYPWPLGEERTTRTCDGKVEEVGVAGRTLIEPRGERGDFNVMLDMDADDVEEAFECVLLWKERMEDTDDEVEFRPPRPRPDGRRYEDVCGVNGPGEREFRFGGGVPR